MTFDLRNIDCMELMAEIEDKSQNLIIVDPPYFEVKGKFDFIWDSFDDYLKDVEKWAKEIKRILADNGTLFWWGHAKKIAYSQIILDKYFALENSLVWKKTDSQTRAQDFEASRIFAPVTERLLMYSNDHEPTDWAKTGTERIMEEHIKLRHSFANYMREEFKLAGVSIAEVRRYVVNVMKLDSAMVNRWLDGDCIISEERYLMFRDFLNGEFLRKEYEELRKEYEELRRPFDNIMKLKDVLEFSQETCKTSKWKHPTQKPPTICKALIKTCSRPGDSLFIPFLGSGSEAVAGINCGLNVTGSELDKVYFEAMLNRIKEETAQGDIFL